MWLFNTSNFTVYIYSVGNPATAMPGLELGLDCVIINIVNNQSYVAVQNITCSNGSGHGINYGPCSNITIRDMIIGWIGGGDNGGSAGTAPRYGNGMQLNAGSFCLVERNQVFQCYDGGITQENYGSSAIVMHDVTYRNNVITACCGSNMEVAGPTGSGSSMYNIYTYNNTTINSGIGWSSTPRCGGDNPAVAITIGGITPSSNFVLENNVFVGHGGSDGQIDSATWADGVMISNYNCWYDSSQTVNMYIGGSNPSIASWAAGYSPALETHGLVAVNPDVTNATDTSYVLSDYVPASGSPLFGAGVNLYSAGVVWDITKKPRPASGLFTIGAFQ